MSNADPLPYRATLDHYQHQADALFDALKSADESAAWRFKWLHPRFRGQPVSDVKGAALDMYDQQCTKMSMLVSSSHPAEAGLQAVLAETLVDYGARLDGVGSAWQSAVMTALTFGYLNTAEALARRGAPLDNLPTVAGLGRLQAAARLLPAADGRSRHIALALAAQLGHADVVRPLLDAGEDPDRFNPEGFHPHATALHHAALHNHAEVVRLLVEGGARLEIRDTIYRSTPLDWAIHAGRTAIAEFLRDREQAGT